MYESLIRPRWAFKYNRSAAESDVKRFWNKPCHDLFVCVAGSSSKCSGKKLVKVSSEAIFLLDLKLPSEDVKDKTGATVLVPWECLEDCTHFTSCCIGTPPGEKGGGFPLSAKGGPPGGPYGERDATSLVNVLERSKDVKRLIEKSTDTKLPVEMGKGDVIAYFNKKAKAYTHVVLYMGSGKIAAHASHAANSVSRSPKGSAVVSDWKYLSGNPDFSWSMYHFATAQTISPFRPDEYALEFGAEVAAEDQLDKITEHPDLGKLPLC